MVKLELSLRARGLKNIAGLLKGTSDPFAVVTKVPSTTEEKYEVLGKTEVVKNSLDPEWVKVFAFDYQLGSPTKVAITVYDDVSKGSNKSYGMVFFDIGTLLGSRGGTQGKQMKDGGMLYASVRKSKGNGTMTLKLEGKDLKNLEGFGVFRKSDPFFEICRKTELGWDTVHRSDFIKNNLSPDWEEVTLELSVLCDGDLDLPIQVRIYDHEGSGKHEMMGVLETTTNELFTAGRDKTELSMGKGAGFLIVNKATLSGPEFADYVAGGCQINVVMAIDFTGSNGDPRKEGTLHYFHTDGSHNDYEKAITAIVGILSKYDHDKKYPVLGFGAKYDGEVRHKFQVGESEEVEGVDGVLSAYKNVFQSGLIMSGPTVIKEVIEVAASRAESSLEEALANESQTYTVLVILTDGCVSDMTSTIMCLLENCDKPLSIVVVGLGDEDFSQMHTLDDLRRPGKRNMLQFVAFNEHKKNPVDLTSATLAEVPHQLEEFFHSRGIQPLSAIELEEEEIAVSPFEEEEEIDLTLAFEEDEIVVSAGDIGVQEW